MRKSFLAFLPALLLASCGGEETKPVTEISLDELPNGLDVGEQIDLDEESGLSGVSWKIDDDLVAKLEDGKLTALRSGVISVTATSTSDPTVEEQKYITVSALSGVAVSFGAKTSTVRVGETYKFTATVNGNLPDKSVGFLVSNDAIASIDEDGTLHAYAVGKITVTAYSLYNPDSFTTTDVEIVANGTLTEVEGQIETKDVNTGSATETYKLVWEDDFNGSRLNKASWEPMVGNGSAYNNPGWGNEEQEFYKEDNAKVVDGELVITAKYGDPDKGLGLPTTSARLRTAKKVAYTYGYIEARISCPEGYGLWPAFWMLPEAEGTNAYGAWPNSGEIDILEAKGRIPSGMDGTIHFATELGDHTYHNGHYDYPDRDDTIMNYHTYAVRWEEGYIGWYCDGNLYFEQTADDWTMKTGTGEGAAPFDKSFHILLNLAVGGNYDGGRMPSASELPARMKVDYVKWYQK